MKNFNNWFKAYLVIFSLIILLVGFAIGSIYSDKFESECKLKPFYYGIKKLNDANDDYFTCSCISKTYKTFSFNEEGLLDK